MHTIHYLAYVSSCLIQSGTEDLARQPDEDTDEEDNVILNCQVNMNLRLHLR